MKTIPAFYFVPAQLQELAEQQRNIFRSAVPFPHVVIDDFVPENILNLVVDEFPAPDDIDWTLWGAGDTKQTKNKHVEKIGTSDENQFGPFTRHFMSQLNSATFLKFIENLTGVPNIIVDPTYNRCGLHSTGRGGKLMIHTDTNRHPVKGKFDQRFNLILFLNKDWKEEYGGHLELWNRDVTRCEKRILPIFNRMVFFDTGKYSYHGHPQPLTCPESRRRNSIAIYYYVLDRPHDANYSGMQSIRWVATTFEEKNYQRKAQIKRGIKKFVPPIISDVLDRFKKMR